jgi:hypothetical protein
MTMGVRVPPKWAATNLVPWPRGEVAGNLMESWTNDPKKNSDVEAKWGMNVFIKR